MTVGFFMPLPLAVMIPFMAGQSFAMGEAFGKGFQYGKRRISAMTNEEFNSMSAKDHFEETTADISEMIPSMKSQMNNFSTLQTDIIKTLIEQLKDAGITIGEAVGDVLTDTISDGPPGGTELAQEALSQLRSLVGLPPIYSKLVAPSGIAALINFWNKAGQSSALKLSLNPTQWIWNSLKNIFNQTTPTNTMTSLYNLLDSQGMFAASTQIGPVEDDGTAPIEPTEDSGVIDDTRIDDGKSDPTSSQITEFNKLNEELRAEWTRLLPGLDKSSQQYIQSRANVISVEGRMYAMWQKLKLIGKVSTSWYGVRTDPFTDSAAFKLL